MRFVLVAFCVDAENDILDILYADDVPPDWLIPEMVAQGAFITLVGESGAGKSVISYTLAMAVAAGCRAFSGIVPAGEPRRVLYFDDENSTQDRNKYLKQAWFGLQKANGKVPNPSLLLQNFWVIGSALGTDEWPETMCEWIDHVKPHFIVVDTAPACFNIDDENSNAEASKAIKEMKRLMRTVDPTASAWVLKHAKTRTERGQVRTVRGAKVWKDMSDGVLFQIKAGGRPRKDHLSLTRLVPDKVRAYGLRQSIYITPRWTNDARQGLLLEGSYSAGKDHRDAESED